jgi:hypothetical protein
MKRALTVAVISGLAIFAVPQVAFADHAPGHGGECAGQTEQAAGPGADCAAQPEGAGGAEDRPAPDDPGRHENHDGDDGTILF